MRYLLHGLFVFALILTGLKASGQAALNVTELGHLTYTEELNEVRGAKHNGREYALVGTHNGLSIVDVEDPNNPEQVFFEAGPNSTWRDPFYHNGHAFCVTEGGGGLLIVDMNPLSPVNTSLTSTLYTGNITSTSLSSAHNMFIDGPNDMAYIFGTDQIDGVIMLDISNPMSPVELGTWNDFYIHDGFVRGDTLWAACLEDGVFVVDVSTPSNPVILANWDTPSEFAHNVWPSDDNAFCYTTDEVSSGFVAVYDMSNFQNVVEVDKAQHPLSTGVIPHNAHFMNDFVITAHYRDGVSIHDVSDPSNIVLTGYFDSSPLTENGFNGAWGAWPYLPSGNLLVADIEEGLFVLGPTYVQAARLEGMVTDLSSGNPLNGVQVEIVGTSVLEFTDIFGNYAAGLEAANTYDITFAKGGYLPQTITGVVLQNGQTETLDVQLIADVPFLLSGFVTEVGTGAPIEGATVQIVNEFFDIELTSDATGKYIANTFYEGEYEVVVASWGYIGQCSNLTVTQSSAPDFELVPGYHDDFVLDLGWTTSGNASAGLWERGYPIATDFGGTVSNPGEDVSGDCGGQAFITGNAGGSAGNDDVDDGTTILLSPIMDLSGMAHAFFKFDYWFLNAGGDGSPNDQFIVKVDDGTSLTTLSSLPTTNSSWTSHTVSIDGSTALTSSMQLRIEVKDSDPGHLVEGGLDRFRIMDAVGITESENATAVNLYPNPTNSRYVKVAVNNRFQDGFVLIYDVTGKAISENVKLTLGENIIKAPTVSGVYLLETVIDGNKTVQRLLVSE